jgi:hypothetical protein
VPTLHVTATEDIIRIPGYYSGAEDRIAVFEAMPGAARSWRCSRAARTACSPIVPAPAA